MMCQYVSEQDLETFPGIEYSILDKACNQVDINAATEFVI